MAYSGKFFPKNPQKYKGNVNNIIWRSTWELLFLKYLDASPSILEYGSEEIVIPYVSPLDNKIHRYFVDFYFVAKDKSGTIRKHLVEIKPHNQVIMPKKPKVISESYIKSVKTYLVNKAKWKAAEEFAKKNNINFEILTERRLFKHNK